ncbi:MAG: translation initiation factor IF-3 [Bdellovibrionota bacterium]
MRVNRSVRAPKVRVVLEDGGMLGVMSSRDAYEEAMKRGLDLVEISPNANPPVCKIMDYGKFKYEQKKKSQGQKKQSSSVLKELTLGPQTQEHDIGFKVKNAIRFLEDGHRVKFTVRFRGRQMAHPEIGRQTLQKALDALKDYANVEVEPKLEGRFLAAILSPQPHVVKSRNKAQKSSKEADEKESGLAKESAPIS